MPLGTSLLDDGGEANPIEYRCPYCIATLNTRQSRNTHVYKMHHKQNKDVNERKCLDKLAEKAMIKA